MRSRGCKNVPFLRRCSPSARSRVSLALPPASCFFSLSPDWLCLTPSRTPTRVRVSPSRLVPVALFEFFFFPLPLSLPTCFAHLLRRSANLHFASSRCDAHTCLSFVPAVMFFQMSSPAAAPQNEISTPFESPLGQCHAYNPTIRVSQQSVSYFFLLCWH